MLHNNLYNLIMQLTEENKSLWRIKNEYAKDAEGDEKASEFWKKLEKDKEDHVKELTELIREQL